MAIISLHINNNLVLLNDIFKRYVNEYRFSKG